MSTLIILRDLLCKIGKEVDGRETPMPPKDVFDVIVGTSTGGLIALMMVKLGLDVEECIHEYRKLSKRIFGKPNSIGKWTVGLVKPRYSGQLVRRLVIELISQSREGHGEEFLMENNNYDSGVHCSVLCRELENNWKKTRKSKPVFLCSHKCRIQPGFTYKPCKMCDAACATSAAPTYFEAKKILNKILVDGGFGDTNNPSFEAFNHYRTENKSWSRSEKLIWLNIGTGSPQPDTNTTETKRPMWTWLFPDFLLYPYHLMDDMQKMAVDAEDVVKIMKTLAKETHGDLQYSRYSANNGLHLIGLDDFAKVDDGTIERLTKTYLDQPSVQADLIVTAQALAAEYKARRVAPVRQDNQVSSPVPNSPNLNPNSPLRAHQPSSPLRAPQPQSEPSSPIFPDDLSGLELPGLTRKIPTDEASTPPRTPRPEIVQPVPRHLREGSSKPSHTLAESGGQFTERGTPPRLTIIIDDHDEVLKLMKLRGDQYM